MAALATLPCAFSMPRERNRLSRASSGDPPRRASRPSARRSRHAPAAGAAPPRQRGEPHRVREPPRGRQPAPPRRGALLGVRGTEGRGVWPGSARRAGRAARAAPASWPVASSKRGPRRAAHASCRRTPRARLIRSGRATTCKRLHPGPRGASGPLPDRPGSPETGGQDHRQERRRPADGPRIGCRPEKVEAGSPFRIESDFITVPRSCPGRPEARRVARTSRPSRRCSRRRWHRRELPSRDRGRA